MGHLKKPTYTKPLPDDAIIAKKGKVVVARWTMRGEAREAPVIVGKDGSRRVRLSVATWHACYKDHEGIERSVDTKCEDKAAANGALFQLERQAEQIRAGHVTIAEVQQAEQRARPFTEILDAFLSDRKSKKRDNAYVYELKRMLGKIAQDCKFATLADISLERIETWVAGRLADGTGINTIKHHTDALRALCRWAVRRSRLKVDPTLGLELASGEMDRRRIRRAYSEEEFARLLAATQARPERDAAMIRRGSRKGQLGTLKPEVREKMRLVGRERSLVYRTLLLTGLRLDELRQTRVHQVSFSGPSPAIKLDAAQAKSRRAQRVELPDALAGELATWVQERGLAPQDKLLFVPDDWDRVQRLDAAMAGLEVKDPSGRSLDTHALRHTLATRLADDGVPLVVTQAIMRHSDPRLTAGAYLDSEALTTKKPAIDQISHDLTIAVAKSYRDASPDRTPLTRELAAQLAVQLAVIPADQLRQAQDGPDVYEHVRRALSVGREQVRSFEEEIRQAVERAYSGFYQLPGQDSNLEKQDQNLL